MLTSEPKRPARWLAFLGPLLLCLLFVASSPAASPMWIVADDMTTARFAHTATLLDNGDVLVAGGTTQVTDPMGMVVSVPTPTAELYHPNLNTWVATQPMSVARYSSTATRLLDGRVLVAGGNTSTSVPSVTRTAEIYDPATEQWSSTGDMLYERAAHTATLLPGGRVLVVGGTSTADTSAAATAEIYDPGTGTWTATAGLRCKRLQHVAEQLPTGEVLVAAGANAGCSTGDPLVAERFDSNWTDAGALPGYAFSPASPASSTLADGSVLVAGGSTCCATYKTTDVFTPGTNSWTQVGDMGTPRWVFAATLLRDGKVLVEGGHVGAPSQATTTSAELYDPASQTWSPTASMTFSRHGHTATLLPDGSVLAAGGSDNAGHTWATTERYFSPTTAVTVRTVTASRRAHSVVVRWSTASEARLLGFNVYRQRRGKLVRLNRTLIPSVFGGTATGHAYSWVDRTVTKAPARYRLQAVTVDGTRTWAGSATA